MPERVRTYLDWNATAPLSAAARQAVLAALELQGNPSSVHGEGRAARALIDGARRDIAALAGAEAAHVTFTSGATEAANTVLTPDFRMGRTPLSIGRLYVSAIEHPAVREGGQNSVCLGHDGGCIDVVSSHTELCSQEAGTRGSRQATPPLTATTAAERRSARLRSKAAARARGLPISGIEVGDTNAPSGPGR